MKQYHQSLWVHEPGRDLREWVGTSCSRSTNIREDVVAHLRHCDKQVVTAKQVATELKRDVGIIKNHLEGLVGRCVQAEREYSHVTKYIVLPLDEWDMENIPYHCLRVRKFDTYECFVFFREYLKRRMPKDSFVTWSIAQRLPFRPFYYSMFKTCMKKLVEVGEFTESKHGTTTRYTPTKNFK